MHHVIFFFYDLRQGLKFCHLATERDPLFLWCRAEVPKLFTVRPILEIIFILAIYNILMMEIENN